jgi:hypothetical protein
LTWSTSSGGQNWTPGRPGAKIGTREWADYIRLHVTANVDHLGEQDESFAGSLEFMHRENAWPLLTRKDGSMFRNMAEFIVYPSPWGLGKKWKTLEPYVTAGLAKLGKSPEEIERFTLAARAETVAPMAKAGGPRQGAGRPQLELAPLPKAESREAEPASEVNQADMVSLIAPEQPGPKPKHGNDATYLTSRIARDAPEVLERMKAGEFKSARAAAIEAGIVKPPDIFRALCRLWGKATEAERARFLSFADDGAGK